MKTEQMDEFKDKVEVTSEEVSDDLGTYTHFEITIKELYGYGVVLFDTPLIVRGAIKKGGDVAHYHYDFGMEDKLPLKKENNFLYNYSGENNECDPVKTVISSVKYDLMHAFNHTDLDPNFGHRHWALRECLRDRVTSFDWYEEEDLKFYKECIKNPKPKSEDKLNRYDDSAGDNQKWGKISKIIVPTQEDKEQLLLAIEYIHNCNIDTDYMMVNTLAHLYKHPEIVEVQKPA